VALAEAVEKPKAYLRDGGGGLPAEVLAPVNHLDLPAARLDVARV